MSFITYSTFAWVQDVFSLLVKGRSYPSKSLEYSDNLLDKAHFALDILNGSSFCLHTIAAESELVQGILSAVFLIDWEFGWINISKDKLDEERMKELEARLTLFEAAHAFRCKLSDHFLKGFGVNIRRSLSITLIQSIKCITFVDNGFDSDNFVSACCKWAHDVFELFCQDQDEEQQLLDQLLSKNDSWPFWIIPERAGARLKTENVSLNVSVACGISFSISVKLTFMIVPLS